MTAHSEIDEAFMRRALRLAKRGYGMTSPNPMVGAVLVRHGDAIGEGWHREAGRPHAEIEAIADAQSKGHRPRGATLYVTLEPCSTYGRTPPCTEAIRAAGIRRLVVAAIDPNPKHSGQGLELLRRDGIEISSGVLGDEATRMNETFNHWIVHGTPFVLVKAAMTLDGKIATPSGESKWITSEQARKWAMKIRRGVDAILVGVNTILTDDPSLTARARTDIATTRRRLRRIVLDSEASTPPEARVVTDQFAELTTVVVTKAASEKRVAALAKRVQIWTAPTRDERIDVQWVLRRLGAENVTSLLVEGGGEVNASFLISRLAQRILFFYAPKILGGTKARKAVAGRGAHIASEVVELHHLEWKRLGPDLLLTARTN